MESILQRITESGLNLPHLLITGGSLLAALLIIGFLGRLLFSDKGTLCRSISSSIATFYIYAIWICAYAFSWPVLHYLPTLPMISVSGQTLSFFSFSGSSFPVICTELVRMVLLAFFVNLADQWMPRGKNIFSWILFRVLTILLAMVFHFVANWLLTRFVPQGIAAYSAMILLGILVLMIVTGGMRLLVGLALTAVNPIIAALYTFFFANVVGKQITKAVLTTVILSATLFALDYFGIGELSIAAAGLIAYVPLLVILLVLWFIVGKFL